MPSSTIETTDKCGADGQDCPDNCDRCVVDTLDLWCDDCRFYAAQDGVA